MRVVDDETRRVIMQNRIDALEADNLFENLKIAEQEEEEDPGDEMWDDLMSGSDQEVFKTSKSKGPRSSQRKTRSQGQDLSKNLLQQSRMSSTNIAKDAAGKRGQRGKLDLAKVFY